MYIKDNRFCYWDCQHISDTALVLWNMFVTLCLTLYIFKIYRQSMKVLHKDTAKFYHMLLGWGIVYVIADTFAVTVYFSLYDYKDEDYERTNTNFQQTITRYSAIYESIESIPALLLQSLQFLIPYTMIGNLMRISERKLKIQLEPSEKRWYMFLMTYRFVRLVVILPLILILIIGLQNPFTNQAYILEILTITKTSMLIFDSTLSSLLLLFTYRYLIKKYQQLKMENKKEEEALRRQSIALAFGSICRTILNFVFYIIFPIVLSEETRAVCLHKSFKPDFFYGYLMFGTFLMHFFPVIIITNMYKIK